MNLHALRIFTKVAALKSVTKASEALSISQPAVTIQIRNLEKEIGLKLIENDGRGIKLTKEGEFLVLHAEGLFNLENDIEKKLVQLKNGEYQELRISSTYLPANFLLPTWLAKFKQSFPFVKINLYSGNSNQALDKLFRYQSDIAFIVKEEWEDSNIKRHHLFDLDYWFIVPTGHKFNGKEVSLRELVSEPFLLREEGSSTREILFSLCKINNVPIPKVGLEFHGLQESIHSVVAGYGTMLAPALAVKDYLKRNEVGRVIVKDVEIKRPVFLCRRCEDIEWSVHYNNFIEIVKNDLK